MDLQNLTYISKLISKDFDGDQIKINQQMSKFFKKARENVKNNKCFYCNKAVDSFCNSHNIPAFCLKNISTKGKIFTANSIIKFPFYLKEEVGVNNAGTFHIICKDCDNTLFQEYEDPFAYNAPPTHKMLTAIALKCSLKNIYKRKIETEMFKMIQATAKTKHIMHNNIVNALDLQDYTSDYNKAKKYLNSNDNDGYYLIYFDLLNYTVPIAFQGQIALYVDFDGNIVNDIYNQNPKYHIKALFLCVFPLKDKTAIILFIDNKEKRFTKFYKKLKSLSHREKLSVLNYLIFLYSEDFFYSEKLEQIFANDMHVKEITGKTTTIGFSIEDILRTDMFKHIKKEYDLNQYVDFPNFLSEEYKL